MKRARFMPETLEVRVARFWVAALVAALAPEGSPLPMPSSFERAQALSVLRDAARAVHRSVDEVEHERSLAWLGRLGAAVDLLAREESPALAQSALVWAAVSAWQDLGGAPWARCAAACARLARRLEPADADTLAPRIADALRRSLDREADRLWLGVVRRPFVPAVASTTATAGGAA